MACPGQEPVEYTEETIVVLSGLEHIRQRPAMYIGSTGPRGLCDLLFELVIQSLAEVVAGYGRSVRLTLRADGSVEVDDDGRVLPAIEQAFAVLDGHHGYCPYPSGRGYFGYPVANALSEWLRVEARSGAEVRIHQFQRGAAEPSAQLVGALARDGLTIAFRPDPAIFGAAQFDAGEIRERLQQLAFSHSGVRITFADETTGTRDEFEFADGIRECVKFLNEGRRPLHDAMIIRGEEQGVRYEVGLQWCAEAEEVRRSFANQRYTANGGTHDAGLRAGAAMGLLDFIREHAPQSVELTPEDRRAGLTAVVSVWLRDVMFESATRSRLNNSEVEGIVRAAVRRGVCDYFEANRAAADRVVKAISEKQAARSTQKKTRSEEESV